MASSTLTKLTQLRSREQVAERTMAFHFEKPAGFEFRPGQTIDLTLINPPETDAEGNTRTFSIASAPGDPALMIATRMRGSAFKRVLSTMPIGGVLQIDGPGGSFTLPRSSARTVVLIAGGIGITPFSSMARHAARERLPHHLYLFSSNRRPEDAPFLDLLQELAKENPNFHFIPTMTEMKNSRRDWNGETRLIDREMLAHHLPSLQEPIYYIAGPPGLVAAMRQMLIAAQADEDSIRTDEFFGY